ncbi:hypothetical protein BDR26DRAFT_872128 [Obelidium mucronatum]|nr:hypothetical protein BDR26DRAFT_872128 [Obelidium mucronatum]
MSNSIVAELERKAELNSSSRHQRSASVIPSPYLTSLSLHNYPKHPTINVHDDPSPNPRHERRATIQVHSNSADERAKVVLVPPVPGMSEEELRGSRNSQGRDRRWPWSKNSGTPALASSARHQANFQTPKKMSSNGPPLPADQSTVTATATADQVTSTARQISEEVKPKQPHVSVSTLSATKRAQRPSIAAQNAQCLKPTVNGSNSTSINMNPSSGSGIRSGSIMPVSPTSTKVPKQQPPPPPQTAAATNPRKIVTQIPAPPKAMTTNSLLIPAAAESSNSTWTATGSESISQESIQINPSLKSIAPSIYHMKKRVAPVPLQPIGTASLIRPADYVDVIDTVLDFGIDGKKKQQQQPHSQPMTGIMGKISALGSNVFGKLDYAGQKISSFFGLLEGRYEEYYTDCEEYERDLVVGSIDAGERVAAGELRDALEDVV